MAGPEARFAAKGNTWFLVWAAGLVLCMQVGFCMLEAGSVRRQNSKYILLKNMLDTCFGAVIWWLVGYGLAYGDSNDGPFVGTGPSAFALSTEDWLPSYEDEGADWAFWFFQFTFAAAAATIVSGGVAERCALSAYLAVSVSLMGFIYPVAAHWVWDDQGFLSAFNTAAGQAGPLYGGCIDFAGSGVVHATGGISALVGAYFLGPRIGRCALWGLWALAPACVRAPEAWSPCDAGRWGLAHCSPPLPRECYAALHVFAAARCPRARRFRPNPNSRFDAGHNPVPHPPHDPMLQTLGVFILWFGWYGFNAGSALAIFEAEGGGLARDVARICVNTTLSAGTCGVLVVVSSFRARRVWDPSAAGNGVLAGLVSITAGCSTLDPWAAIVVGAVGALVYFYTSRLLLRLRIDDPLDACAVHGGCGIWGVLAVGLLCRPEYTYNQNGAYGLVFAASGGRSARPDGRGGADLLVAQVVFIAILTPWVTTLSGTIFLLLSRLRVLRIPPDEELQTMDESKRGDMDWLIAELADGERLNGATGANVVDAGQPRALRDPPQGLAAVRQ